MSYGGEKCCWKGNGEDLHKIKDFWQDGHLNGRRSTKPGGQVYPQIASHCVFS